jgi:hypothetical protein
LTGYASAWFGLVGVRVLMKKEIRPIYKIFSLQLDCSVDPVTGALMDRNFGNMIMFSEELFNARLKY